MWLKNCWYVAAYASELADGNVVARRVLDEPLILYLTSNDTVVALEDRCPHRHAPLSAGKREGDNIRCGYHGLVVNQDGRCVGVPGMEQPPSDIKVRSYPVVVHHTWVFVWMGVPEKADQTMLPDNWSCDDPNWKNIPGYLHYETPYLLICDNLLDFSHLSFVHEKSLGGSPRIALARPTIEPVTEPGQRGVRVTRHISDVPAPPFYQRFRDFDSNLDRWFVYDFLLPGTLLMSSGGRPVGDSIDDNSRAVRLHSCQTLTPETATSTHYFWQQSHPRASDDDGIAESIHQSIIGAFEEDRAMISAQYTRIQDDPLRPMVPLHMDRAVLEFRALLEAQSALENSAQQGPASSHA
jgi:phenylpropionate dioxygenase-like ring-hydroxylating dioxygenase large terminal subunit